MAQPEHLIQNQIRLALSANQCTVFRINVGKFRLPDGTLFQTGVPRGYSDLSGFRWSDGKAFFIEVKTQTGRPRQDQIKFHHMLTSHGIVHGIARSPEDAIKIVKEGLVGYGFKDYEDN
ncbi:VRR-NUC domain-containing protein [Limosilactobacillus fermentum]